VKKYLPLIVGGICFFILLALQIAGEGFFQSKDKEARKERRKKELEALFISTEMTTTPPSSIKYNLKEVKSPLILINFWASWCVPCLEEFPALTRLRSRFDEKDLLIIGINNDMEDGLNKIKKIEKKYKLNFPSVPDLEGEITDRFDVENLPATILYANGKAVFFKDGPLKFDSDEFVGRIKSHLKSSRN